MGSHYHRAYACPYYTSDAKGRIVCEAGQIRMRSTTMTLAYADSYCCSVTDWPRCTLAQAVTVEYEKKGRG